MDLINGKEDDTNVKATSCTYSNLKPNSESFDEFLNTLEEVLSESEQETQTSAIFQNENTILTSKVIDKMWRYFRNVDEECSKYLNPPQIEDITEKEMYMYQNVYKQFQPMFRKSLKFMNSILFFWGNKREDDYLIIYKNGYKFMCITDNFPNDTYTKMLDQFMEHSNSTGSFEKKFVVMLSSF